MPGFGKFELEAAPASEAGAKEEGIKGASKKTYAPKSPGLLEVMMKTLKERMIGQASPDKD
jgi:hypothetical protein